MSERIVESNSAKETFSLGTQLAANAKPGEVYCLNGDLGVGKTVFTQGFARGLGITETVNSPTFTIVQSYTEGRMPFFHFDVYRIENSDEMEEIGFDDCIYGGGVTLIEWAERIEEILPDDCRKISIMKDCEKGFDYRRIILTNC